MFSLWLYPKQVERNKKNVSMFWLNKQTHAHAHTIVPALWCVHVHVCVYPDDVLLISPQKIYGGYLLGAHNNDIISKSDEYPQHVVIEKQEKVLILFG